jgi:fructan beta-fructosidase
MLTLLLAAAFTQTAMPTQLYNETYRPEFHFSPKKDWLNDPNGMVYYKGTWHLFYQYAEDVRGNSPKFWGYATSKDLVHWKEHDLAFKPDKNGAVWSGGAAVDWTNSTGFGKNGKPPLVGMYTAAGNPFTQCLVYSDDEGKTWSKYAKPVIGHIVHENRDPRPVWYEPTKSWVTALYLDGNDFVFFGSKDMKSWTEFSRLNLPGSAECPELFEMPIERSKGEKRWVFFGGNYRYLIGTFDGKTFKPEVGPIQGDFGGSFYASQTFSDGPDGRRVQIAWMPKGEPFPGMDFTGQMSFPCELKLRRTAQGLRVFRNPVKEISKLYDKVQEWKDVAVQPDKNPIAGIAGELLDVEVEFALGDAKEVGLRLRGATVSFVDGKLKSLDHSVEVAPKNGRVKFRVLVDRVTVEAFAADGLVSLTSYFQPEASQRAVEAFATGGSAKIVKLTVRQLKSAW